MVSWCVFFVLSKTLDLLVAPLAWVIILLLWAGLGRWEPWGQRRWMFRGAQAAPWMALGVVLVFSNEWVARRLALSLEEPALSTYDPNATYDVVVVLGGLAQETHPGGTAVEFNERVERLIAAYDLLRHGRARYVLLSGGVEEHGYRSEAAILARQLEDWGIERGRILVEGKSRNTWENAQFSAPILREHGWSRILVVTSAAHMPRAAGCFVKSGVKADYWSVDFLIDRTHPLAENWLPRATNLDMATDAIREWVGRWTYALRGYN